MNVTRWILLLALFLVGCWWIAGEHNGRLQARDGGVRLVVGTAVGSGTTSQDASATLRLTSHVGQPEAGPVSSSATDGWILVSGFLPLPHSAGLGEPETAVDQQYLPLVTK